MNYLDDLGETVEVVYELPIGCERAINCDGYQLNPLAVGSKMMC